MEEIWKPVVGFEGLYEVSNYGNVRSLSHRQSFEFRDTIRTRTIKGKMLKPAIVDGYHRVQLFKDGVGYNKPVHRLVAIAFIENPNEYPMINHRDENRTNNRVDNLEWCTSKYNANYGNASAKKSAARSKPCMAIYPNGTIRAFESTLEAGKALGVAQSHISQACSGKRHTSAGAKWMYIDHDKG